MRYLSDRDRWFYKLFPERKLTKRFRGFSTIAPVEPLDIATVPEPTVAPVEVPPTYEDHFAQASSGPAYELPDAAPLVDISPQSHEGLAALVQQGQVPPECSPGLELDFAPNPAALEIADALQQAQQDPVLEPAPGGLEQILGPEPTAPTGVPGL